MGKEEKRWKAYASLFTITTNLHPTACNYSVLGRKTVAAKCSTFHDAVLLLRQSIFCKIEGNKSYCGAADSQV